MSKRSARRKLACQKQTNPSAQNGGGSKNCSDAENPSNCAPHQKTAGAPKHNQQTDANNNKVNSPRNGPFSRVIAFINAHNGAVTAMATVIMAYLSYAMADTAIKQFEITRGQLAAMEADQRPWLGIDIKLITPFKVSPTGVATAISVSIKNHGRLPASNVLEQSDFVSGTFHEVLAKQNAICEDLARGRAESNAGVTIFPSITFETSNTLIFPMKEPPKMQGIAEQLNKSIFIGIAGCVIYSFSNGRHGTTKFHYSVAKNVPGSTVVLGKGYLIERADSSIEPDKIVMWPDLWGNTAE